MQRLWGTMLIGLGLIAYSTWFLIEPKVTSPGAAPCSDLGPPLSTISQDSVLQACSQANLVGRGIFSVEIPPSQMTPAWFKVR